MFIQPLVEIAKNTTIKLVAKGVPGALAVIGGATAIGITAGYITHEYLNYKVRIAEIELQQTLSMLRKNAQCEDDNDGNDDGPTPIAA